MVYETSEQHKSLSHSRISPYTEDEALKNIVTGVVADESVNVVLFQTNGDELINKWKGTFN